MRGEITKYCNYQTLSLYRQSPVKNQLVKPQKFPIHSSRDYIKVLCDKYFDLANKLKLCQ